MIDAGDLGLLAVLAFVFLLVTLVGLSRMPLPLKTVIIAAILLRVVGAVARYFVLYDLYGGQGDAGLYYSWGLRYAERFWDFDFSPLVDPAQWRHPRWWGTQFINFPSAFVLTLIGPTQLGAFISFSLLSFLGLTCFAVAYRRSYPQASPTRYAAWIFLFPPLWFWPASIGKEAIMMMGLGLAMAGFVGRNNTASNWPLLLVGLFFVFAVRPQVAAVLIVAIVLGQWLSLAGRWTVGRAVQGLMILAVGMGGIWLSMRYMGVESFDVEGVVSYMEDNAAQSSGGSQIGTVGVGLEKVPLALLNIFARPFPWEARSPLVLLSALEILVLWAMVWRRRKNLRAVLRNWRQDRLVRTAIPFILLYAASLGMLIANLGIIARQRVLILPFVFLVIEAAPRLARYGRGSVSGPSPQRPSSGVADRALAQVGSDASAPRAGAWPIGRERP